MRLKLVQPAAVHTEIAVAVGFNAWNECYSVSDDQTIHKWNMRGESEGKARVLLTGRVLNTCCD